ncbi:MAG: glycoside hydrolase family 27 protein [Terracidiphilus sp.]|jgi:hypothetical protein
MTRRSFFFAAIFAVAGLALPAIDSLHAQTLAPTPPMGWNSWDAYGFTIDENDFKANVTVLAGMKQYGWSYAVIDEGWYMADPFGKNLEARKYLWDGNGYLIPVDKRFPSSANGAGFKPLADWVHAQGLKFGIHIVRGIPRQVVKDNLPIAGSSFHAADVADMDSPCPWDEGNWGVKDNAAGQAYYDGMLNLYAGWGLDFIKVDCISDRPYRISEIKQIAEAIRKTGRPIVLSLSPGPTNLQHAAEVAKYAQMWRIADDHWDGWMFPHKPGDGEFPFGVRDEFDRLAAWAPYVKPGGWPDADMLPDGSLTPHPGWGGPRQSRITQDEQRTEFTLFAMARSPLIYGGNLIKLDDFTRSLMTNKDVIEINQKTWESQPVKDLPVGFENVRVWTASEEAFANPPEFLALFNLDDKPVTLHFKWEQVCARCAKSEAHNLFDGSHFKTSEPAEIALPAHGSAVYRVQRHLN